MSNVIEFPVNTDAGRVILRTMGPGDGQRYSTETKRHIGRLGFRWFDVLKLYVAILTGLE